MYRDLITRGSLAYDTITYVTHLLEQLQTLNSQQQAAVQHLAGPAIVLAGAGSGKTRVLTTRVAWLIEHQKVAAETILLVTFTNKAAGEMTRRVTELTGAKLPFSGTFHSLCARILRREAPGVGLNHDFSIYDSDDQTALISRIFKSHGFDPKKFKPLAVKSAISQAKNELLSPSEYEALAADDYQGFVARVFRIYQTELLKQQAVDFDDLLGLTVQLFQQNQAVLGKYQNLLHHILVDEYQDTNKAQYLLTQLLAVPQNNLYVVGDFAQSIYAWRGADFRNLHRLKQDFPDITEYRLERNYRSTQPILDAASQVISVNTSHPVLKLWTDRPTDTKLQLINVDTGEGEAEQVTRLIQQNRAEFDYRDVAILYRTNAQSRPFEEAFVKTGIPYRLVGGTKFYERKEVKDVLAYLRWLTNPLDEVSLGRIEKLGKRKLASFITWAETHRASLIAQPPLTQLETILTISHYQDQFDPKDEQDAARLENLQELLNVANQFPATTQFLENVALVQDGHLHDLPEGETPNAITLMSLHSAKGLEFPVVFLVGMEEGLLPHSRSLWDKDQMEEERRLCYVGITRAKDQLYFVYANKRWIYGSSSYTTRSRFLNDIAPELLDQKVTRTTPTQGKQWFKTGDDDNQDSPKNFGHFNGGDRFAAGKTIPNWSERWNSHPTPPKSKPGRHIVLDDDIEALLNDELDVGEFLKR
ncbi:MAG TPA: ATP-dependent DNA helicase PcrA [Candidatus Pacebacteria bacterium]|nr:ATP-dependent DNA helicase PcrA [Candidatus Paceibacterota bacterium]